MNTKQLAILVAVGLALIIAVYRHQKNIRLQEANTLRG